MISLHGVRVCHNSRPNPKVTKEGIMKYKIVLPLVIFILICSCFSIAKGEISDVLSYYPYIKEIHNGPIIWHKDTSNPHDLGVMYRAVIFKQEVYYGLIVEKLKVSDEGGLEFVKGDLAKFEMSSHKIIFDTWLAPNTFGVKYGSNAYKIVISEKEGKLSLLIN